MGQRHAARVLRGGIDALIAAVLAPTCAACTAPLDQPASGCVCPVCWGVINLATSSTWTTPHISIGLSAGRYEGVLRDVIHAFKYDGRRSLAEPLGRMMLAAGRPVFDDCDGVVPVPLHPWRRLRRGFNQARDLAACLDRPVVNALWRFRATPPQMALSGTARRTNVRDAFIASPLVTVAGRRLVLVDDVRTTGATLDECAQVLLTAGAREVRALTIAIA